MHFTNLLYYYQRDKTYQLSFQLQWARLLQLMLREMRTVTFELHDVTTRRKMLTCFE